MLKNAAIFLLGCLLIVACHGKNHSMTARPYLSQVTGNSIVVNWHTPDPLESVIAYGETAACEFTVKDSAKKRFHNIKLTKLKPSTKYYYRILSNGKTEIYQFHTAVRAGEEFSFAVYGDTQPNNQNHVDILKQILKKHPLFIMNVGDVVQGDYDADWHDYFTVLCDKTKAGENVPIYSTMGNHDKSENVYDSLYFQYSSLPVNNSDYTEAYYSFNIGNAHFVALNNYLSFDPASPQYKWFAEDLKHSSPYKWKIVFIHEPFYSSGKHGGNMHQRRVLEPLFEKGGVTLVFSGHDHLYQRTKIIKGVTYVVTGGGGAKLYNARQDEWMQIIDKSRHFCNVRITRDQCEIEMIRSDGTVGDRLIIKQPNNTFFKKSDFEKQRNRTPEENTKPILEDESTAWRRFLYNLSVILSNGGHGFLNAKGD